MLEFLVHSHPNIKGKSDEVLPIPTSFLFTIYALKILPSEVIRGIVKQLSELVIFWWSVKKAFDFHLAVCPETCI